MKTKLLIGSGLLLVLLGGFFVLKQIGVPLGSVLGTEKSAKIDQSNKKLSAIPNNILNDGNVQEINLSKNNISGSLPENIKSWKKLNNLDVSNNKINDLPVEIGELINLRSLSLAKNDFTIFPSETLALSRLEVLDISNNNIAWLPTNIAELKNLKKLIIKGNPMARSEILRIKNILTNTSVSF